MDGIICLWHGVRRAMVLGVVLASVVHLAAYGAPAPQLAAATGASSAVDPEQAGAEAAKAALKGLNGAEPVLVLVFDHMPGALAEKEALLKGVSTAFDPSLVYGSDAFGHPITEAGNSGTVAVLALSGPLTVHSAVAAVGGNHRACGERIGAGLQEAAKADAPGRLVVLLGECHVPANADLVQGVNAVLGADFPVVGAAHPLGGYLYCQGKVSQDTGMALLLTGDFRCGYSLRNGDGVEGIITSAGEAAREAVGDGGGRLAALLAFDCAGRMAALGDAPTRTRELEAIKAQAAGKPVFGFYSSGEIGLRPGSKTPEGVGLHLSTCALLRP